jgi:hypothetical protein
VIRSSARRRSVISSCVATHPPSASGLLTICIERPSVVSMLLDHQRHRSVGTPPIAIKLLISTGDEPRELSHINRAGGVGRFCDLPGDQTVHDYVPTSANEVTVMV